MPKLLVTDRAGVQMALDVAGGQSVMEAIRGAGVDDIQALCGGSRSCATCHIYVDESQLAMLPAMDGEEDDLLDSTPHRLSNSRLSCQIAFCDALDGLALTIAPED